MPEKSSAKRGRESRLPSASLLTLSYCIALLRSSKEMADSGKPAGIGLRRGNLMCKTCNILVILWCRGSILLRKGGTPHLYIRAASEGMHQAESGFNRSLELTGHCFLHHTFLYGVEESHHILCISTALCTLCGDLVNVWLFYTLVRKVA